MKRKVCYKFILNFIESQDESFIFETENDDWLFTEPKTKNETKFEDKLVHSAKIQKLWSKCIQKKD